MLPLLAPDAPVVTWWHGPPPDEIATDALGVLANRRITDCAQARRPAGRASPAGRATSSPATPTWPGPGPPRGARCWPRRSTASRPRRCSATSPPRPATRAPRCSPAGSRRGSTSRPRSTSQAAPGISAAELDPDHATSDGDDYTVTIERPDGRSATLTRGNEEPADAAAGHDASSATCWPRSCGGWTRTSSTPRRWPGHRRHVNEARAAGSWSGATRRWPRTRR